MAKGDYLGEFEQIVLLALAQLGAGAYGMPVRRSIEEHTGRSVSVGAVYATLDRLEEKGHISSRYGTPTAARGGRAKRVFRITPRGARALKRSREMLARMWEAAEQSPYFELP